MDNKTKSAITFTRERYILPFTFSIILLIR